MKTYFYELLYIINPVLDDDKIKELVSSINKQIEENNGEIIDTDEWGLRSLAYDIDGKSNGYYVNLYFKAPSDSLPVIERYMRLNDDLMRFLTLKYDAKMRRYYELKKKGEAPTIFEETEEEAEETEED